MISLDVRKNGRLFARSQIEDYICRGIKLEQYSFFSFVVDTYEEAIPRKEEFEVECEEQTSEQSSHAR